MTEQRQFEHMIRKMEDMLRAYEGMIVQKGEEIESVYLETKEHFSAPPKGTYAPARKGTVWGDEWGYAWFCADVTIPAAYDGKKVWIYNHTGCREALVLVDGMPIGLYDNEATNHPYLKHPMALLADKAKAGEKHSVAIETYAGHYCVGCASYENYGRSKDDRGNYQHTYHGLYFATIDEDVLDFVIKLKLLMQTYWSLDGRDGNRYAVLNCLEEVCAEVVQYPVDHPADEWRAAMARCVTLMDRFFAGHPTVNKALIGVTGHSHLDTAWLWPIEETKRKAARTCSNALSMMKLYPEYRFIQSTVLYMRWMKDYYPELFKEIQKRVAEGRFEPNGGSYVECDCNLTGGEAMIRQFVRGQLLLREYFDGYMADTFWLPDTFGYSAAIPQIMRGCGMKYFATTKLGSNDTNAFPYDTFTWRGLDGTDVLTHFNTINNDPDVRELNDCFNGIRHRKVFNGKLVSFGKGDGGGGPYYGMMENLRRVEKMDVLPFRVEYMSVSDFFHHIEETAKDLPVYAGELYYENHRGTLTQMHDIKRTNRKAEIALRTFEALSVLFGQDHKAESDRLFDILMVNQFHDILPGSSIGEVHALAIAQNQQLIAEAEQHADAILASGTKPDESLSLVNLLSFERCDQQTVDLPESELVPDAKHQTYVDLWGNQKCAVGGVKVGSFASACLPLVKEGREEPSAFQWDGKTLETPFARVRFDENGGMASYYDKTAGRELRKPGGLPLNTFLIGEDVPKDYDNWNIDADQMKKMQPTARLEKMEVVSDGCLQFRLRMQYMLDGKSRLRQDVVFYSDSPRVDFETEMDWKSPHTLLKAQFDLDLNITKARHEVQFGYLERPTHRNTSFEHAQFEVSNHKWTDLSESRYGVAILNDCKYGVSTLFSSIGLTLHKGGAHPDISGDCGLHQCVYAFYPHNEGFCAENVIREGYQLNYPCASIQGCLSMDSMLSVDAPNVLIETVKQSEDGSGFVLRLYETENCATDTVLTVGLPFQKAIETNMLEDEADDIPAKAGALHLHFRPFEIKTIKFIQK